MNNAETVERVSRQWRREARWLPVAWALAAAVAAVVGYWRLDRADGSFLAGLLVGGLLMAALAATAYVVRFGTSLSGGPSEAGLIPQAVALLRRR